MNIEAFREKTVLRPDFAHRVVERARKARRRRRLRRQVLSCAAACGVTAFAFLSLRARKLPSWQAPAAVARRYPSIPSQWTASSDELGQSANSSIIVVSEPLAFFFPAATEVAGFQSSQTTYWHSYDPWWNPNL